MTEEKDIQKELSEIEVLYLGIRQRADGKRVYAYMPTDGFTDDDFDRAATQSHSHISHVRWYTKPILPKSARPGSTWLIRTGDEQDGKEGWYTQTDPTKLTGWITMNIRVTMQAVSRAHDDSIKETAKAKKEAAQNFDLEGLTPYRKAYHSLHGRDKQKQFLAEVIYQITRYSKGDFN